MSGLEQDVFDFVLKHVHIPMSWQSDGQVLSLCQCENVFRSMAALRFGMAVVCPIVVDTSSANKYTVFAWSGDRAARTTDRPSQEHRNRLFCWLSSSLRD
jgi:hypothetical protein